MVQTARRLNLQQHCCTDCTEHCPFKSVNSVYAYSLSSAHSQRLQMQYDFMVLLMEGPNRGSLNFQLFILDSISVFQDLKANEKGNKVCFWLTSLMNSIPFYSRTDTTILSSKDIWILRIEKSDLWKRWDRQLCKLKAWTHSVNWMQAITVQFSLSLPHWDVPVVY